MKRYKIHIEADVILAFEPWEGIDLEGYVGQIAEDSIHVPSYINDDSVKIAWRSYNADEIPEAHIDAAAERETP